MGRQIRFCDYGIEELRRLGRAAEEASPGALWFAWRFPDSRPLTRPASELPGDQAGYLVRELDLPNVVTRYVEQQGYWVVSGDPSPVIECARDRIYIMSGYFGSDGGWVPRDKDFVAWYDSIVRWVRRTHRHRPDGFCWEARPAN